jgi:hypothetical protein
MFRIGYAVNGFGNWNRRGMIKAIGKPGEWNGFDFRSPSVLLFGDYTLIAMEGWSDRFSSAIGLMVGFERWLKPFERAVVFNRDQTLIKHLHIGNYGAGDLTINSLLVTNPAFSVQMGDEPYILKPAEKLMIEIHYTPESDLPSAGILQIFSDSMINNPANIMLSGF